MRQSTKVLLFALLSTIWGSTWLVIKIGYGGLGPFNVAALRFFVAGVVFVPLVFVFRAAWPRGRRQWGVVLWVGAALFAADYGLIYWSEQYIESGLTAIIFSILPLVTALLAHVYIPGDRLTPRKIGGTLLAFLGVLALFSDHLRIDPDKALPMLAIVGSAFLAGGASVVSKRHGHDLHPAALNAPAMLFGAVLLAGFSLLLGDGFALPRGAGTWAAVLYLALAGSVVTFLIYFTLLKTWNVTTLSFISVFTPVVALILGSIVLDERPTAWTALGAVLILAGVTIASRTKRAAPAVDTSD